MLFWNKQKWLNKITCRSSHRRRSIRSAVLRKFAKFCSLFLNKVAGLRPVMKACKAVIKPFEAPQRSMKIKV